ncbi:MAG: sigma-70 family RNA polymerase sigma factor [Acidobacteriota bacterium]
MPADDVTQLLHAWRDGDEAARDRLIELLYPQLRRLAGHLRNQRDARDGLQTTELVHEAYLKLIDQTRAGWQDRAHFFAIAARVLRRLIVDHLRHHQRQKRGGDAVHHPLDDVTLPALDGPDAIDVLSLDQALHRLAQIDATAARVVELRYFGGLSHDETADLLNIGRATVGRAWRFARAWLRAQLAATTAVDPL